MRTMMWQGLALNVLIASSLGACKWTEFDDLQNETWVTSTGKPNVKSSDYGLVIQRGDDGSASATSGTLAVIGDAPGSYSELLYNQAGSPGLKPNSLVLGDLGIMTLAPTPPLFLASPSSGEVALITVGDSGSIVVATGVHTLLVRQLFVDSTSLGTSASISTTPDAATYMQPGSFPGIADAPGPEPLVAAGDIVMGTVYGLPSTIKQPACKLVDGTNSIAVRALGVVSNGATDDVLVWNGEDGQLLRYPGSVFNGCTTQAPMAATDATSRPALLPGPGSQILTIDAGRVLLQGHQDVAKGNASFLQVYDTATLHPLGNPIMIDGLRQAAILDLGTTKYVLAGYPTALVDGKTAGQLLVFELSDTGLDTTTPVATLHDAQPDDDQSFGRSVMAMPFNGTQVIAVAADNEIFVYFRANRTDGTDGTNLPLYDETRQGR